MERVIGWLFMVGAVVIWVLPWWMFGVPQDREDIGAMIGLTFAMIMLFLTGFLMRGLH